ncbi:MAG: ATP-binding cassette domain-containing protein [Actinomycetia bacterium]|nr:ATP-binding cassette domain-containing protein [Actinomycetes bacterium]
MLEITDLRKSFGAVRALDGVSLTVSPGETVGFVGANGAGKTTTMRIAMGLLAADSGRVHWAGQRLTFSARERFGYMPEQRGLYPKMRIADQIAYFGQLRGIPEARARSTAIELIERLGVAAEPAALLQNLSLGNQQRVQLAVALVHDPSLLILDEPFSGLDPIGVDALAEVLAERRAAGVGVLFSSHQLELVERLCDRVVIIVAGRIVAAGTLDELRAAAGQRELEVAVAAPDASWLDGLGGVRLTGRDGDRLRLALDRPSDDQAVLAAAARAGRVSRFGWRQPPLAELYREAVQG